MALDPISAVLGIGESVITRLFPDPHKQEEARLKMAEMAQRGDIAELNAYVKLLTAQIEVNKTEAQHKSVFVAGWRPAVGWVCVLILLFNSIGVFLLEYAHNVFELSGEVPERMSMSELWPVLLGMLGVSASRSFDKKNGTQTDSLGG